MTERASTVAREAWAGGTAELAAGVTLLGEYEGSGFTEPHYLIARPDGQVLHVSQLLYLVAAHLDAATEPERVAATVSEEYGRTLSLEGLQFLIDERLRPMGVAAHDPAVEPAEPAEPGPRSTPTTPTTPATAA